MDRLINRSVVQKLARLILPGMLLAAILAACSGGEEQVTESQKKKREKEIQEAIDLIENIKQEDPFDLKKAQERLIKEPDNVCRIGADCVYIDLGKSPDFFMDGSGGVYADRWATLYYRDFWSDMKKTKLIKGGHNPKWNHQPQTPKVVFERFDLNVREMTGINKGISVIDAVSLELTNITDLPGKEPMFVNNDENIVFTIEDERYLVDDVMRVKKISEETYSELVKKPKPQCNWNILLSYRDLEGIWIQSLDERSYCMLWPTENVETVMVIPESCWIYFWNQDNAGILKLRSNGFGTFTLDLGTQDGIRMGDLLDIYEKKVSPLTGEVIGFHSDKWKGTLRVIKVDEESSVAEYHTRLFREPIFKTDAVVLSTDSTVVGSIIGNEM
ncbi:hypothetical protein JW905_06940 [bacterium]|nr:hypothetical protein [candidate division CSSED10-310 bacterium]